MNPSYVDAAQWGKPSWWRYLLGIAIVIVFWMGMGGVFTMMLMLAFDLRGADLMGGDYSTIIGSLTPTQAYMLVNASFLFLLAGTVFVVMAIHRRKARSLVTLVDRINWKRVLQGFAVWFALAAIASLVEYAIEPEAFSFTLNLRAFLPFLLLALILTPIQTTAEEVFFRGYLVQASSLISRNPFFLALFSGILFTLPHLLNPEVENGFVLTTFFYLLLGIFLAYVSIKDGTLELAIGAHAANNLFAALIVNYQDSALPSPSVFWTDRFDPNYNLIAAVLVMAVFYLVVFKLAKPGHT